jgi:hypothetical protein
MALSLNANATRTSGLHVTFGDVTLARKYVCIVLATNSRYCGFARCLLEYFIENGSESMTKTPHRANSDNASAALNFAACDRLKKVLLRRRMIARFGLAGSSTNHGDPDSFQGGAYSAEDDRLFRLNVTGYSAGSAL